MKNPLRPRHNPYVPLRVARRVGGIRAVIGCLYARALTPQSKVQVSDDGYMVTRKYK